MPNQRVVMMQLLTAVIRNWADWPRKTAAAEDHAIYPVRDRVFAWSRRGCCPFLSSIPSRIRQCLPGINETISGSEFPRWKIRTQFQYHQQQYR